MSMSVMAADKSDCWDVFRDKETESPRGIEDVFENEELYFTSLGDKKQTMYSRQSLFCSNEFSSSSDSLSDMETDSIDDFDFMALLDIL